MSSYEQELSIKNWKVKAIIVLGVIAVVLGVVDYSISTQDWNNPIFRYTSQIMSGQCCDNSWVDKYYYGDSNNYDESVHDCKPGYVSSWDSGTVFYCVTPSQAKQDCMTKYPTEYQISEGQVWKRLITLQDNHQLCATSVGTAVGVNPDVKTNITPEEYQKMRSNGVIVGDGSQ